MYFYWLWLLCNKMTVCNLIQGVSLLWTPLTLDLAYFCYCCHQPQQKFLESILKIFKSIYHPPSSFHQHKKNMITHYVGEFSFKARNKNLSSACCKTKCMGEMCIKHNLYVKVSKNIITTKKHHSHHCPSWHQKNRNRVREQVHKQMLNCKGDSRLTVTQRRF